MNKHTFICGLVCIGAYSMSISHIRLPFSSIHCPVLVSTFTLTRSFIMFPIPCICDKEPFITYIDELCTSRHTACHAYLHRQTCQASKLFHVRFFSPIYPRSQQKFHGSHPIYPIMRIVKHHLLVPVYVCERQALFVCMYVSRTNTYLP